MHTRTITIHQRSLQVKIIDIFWILVISEKTLKYHLDIVITPGYSNKSVSGQFKSAFTRCVSNLPFSPNSCLNYLLKVTSIHKSTFQSWLCWCFLSVNFRYVFPTKKYCLFDYKMSIPYKFKKSVIKNMVNEPRSS